MFLIVLLMTFQFARAETPAPAAPDKTEVSPPTPPPIKSAVAPPGPAPGQPSGFYYYCEPRHAYYPTVTDCPSGWIAVPVSAPPMAVQPSYMPWFSPPEPEATPAEVHARPNSVNADLFGRALLYSVNYDRAINPHVTLGLGVSFWSDSSYWSDYSANVFVLPFYGNYYFSEKANRGYVSLGFDYVHVSQSGYDNDTFTNTGFAATVGGGYEHRDASGFLFRLSGFLIAGRSFEISPSVTLGYAF